jgi:hypothetical protein
VEKMKTIKLIARVLLGVLLAAVVGYFIHTGINL